MSDQLIVKLGADTSAFKGAIADAGRSVQGELGSGAGDQAGNKFVDAFSHRLIGARHLSGALATALGLNIEHIAESLARKITGVSKEEEESLKRQIELSDKLTEVTKRTMESQLSDEKLYQLKLIERDQLIKKLESNQGKTTADRNAALEVQIALEENVAELNKLQVSLQQAANKEQEHMKQLLAEYDRQVEENARKRKAEQDKMAEEDLQWYKERTRLEKELQKQKVESLSGEDKIVEINKEITELKKEQLKYDKDSNEYKKLQIQINSDNRDIEQERLNIAKETTKELSDLEKAHLSTASLDSGAMKLVGGLQSYNDPAKQRAYEDQLLASARRDIESEIGALQDKLDQYSKSGSSFGAYEMPALRARINALQGRENHLQDYVFNPNYADAAGKGIFAQQVSTIGDPLKLQTQANDTLKQVAGGVSELNNRLRVAGFGTGG